MPLSQEEINALDSDSVLRLCSESLKLMIKFIETNDLEADFERFLMQEAIMGEGQDN